MAVNRQKFSEIPNDAIILDKKQALEYQFGILKNWHKKTETLAFDYAAYTLGAASIVTSAVINYQFRRRFNLRHYGQISSFLPVCFTSGVVSVSAHQQFVLTDILLRANCPVCLELRSASIQTLIGMIFPLVVAPIMSLSLVHKYATYNLPYVSQEPMKVLRILGEKFRGFKSLTLAMGAAQILLATSVAYAEANAVENVCTQLEQFEADYDRKRLPNERHL